MLLPIPQNNSRGKQTAAAADACTEEAATSAGGGEATQKQEGIRRREAFTSSLPQSTQTGRKHVAAA